MKNLTLVAILGVLFQIKFIKAADFARNIHTDKEDSEMILGVQLNRDKYFNFRPINNILECAKLCNDKFRMASESKMISCYKYSYCQLKNDKKTCVLAESLTQPKPGMTTSDLVSDTEQNSDCSIVSGGKGRFTYYENNLNITKGYHEAKSKLIDEEEEEREHLGNANWIEISGNHDGRATIRSSTCSEHCFDINIYEKDKSCLAFNTCQGLIDRCYLLISTHESAVSSYSRLNYKVRNNLQKAYQDMINAQISTNSSAANNPNYESCHTHIVEMILTDYIHIHASYINTSQITGSYEYNCMFGDTRCQMECAHECSIRDDCQTVVFWSRQVEYKTACLMLLSDLSSKSIDETIVEKLNNLPTGEFTFTKKNSINMRNDHVWSPEEHENQLPSVIKIAAITSIFVCVCVIVFLLFIKEKIKKTTKKEDDVSQLTIMNQVKSSDGV